GLGRVVPEGEPSAQRGGTGLQLCGVRQQRGPDAPVAASQPQPGTARSKEAVLELPRLRRRQTQEALPLPTARPETAQLRPLALAPDGPCPPGATSVKFHTYGLRRCQNGSFVAPPRPTPARTAASPAAASAGCAARSAPWPTAARPGSTSAMQST